MKKLHSFIAFLLLAALLLSIVSFAHPGRTDSKGGHHDGNSYHYHHGYPPHKHTNGECPYNFDDQTKHESSFSKGNKNSHNIHPLADFFITVFVLSSIVVFPYALCPAFKGSFIYKCFKAYKLIFKVIFYTALCLALMYAAAWISKAFIDGVKSVL